MSLIAVSGTLDHPYRLIHITCCLKQILLRKYGELDALEYTGSPVLQRKRLAPAGERDAEALHPVSLGVRLVWEADWAHLKLRLNEASNC